MTVSHDAIVIGAGIVGAACAHALCAEGMQVALVDAGIPGGGVTGAGMGHLVALDETADELALCLLSLRLWDAFLEQHPGVGEASRCGTLWVAENEHQLTEAHQRAARLSQHGWSAEALDGDQVAQLEPALRKGLCGAVRVRGDSVVYPPAVADFLARQLVQHGGVLHLRQQVQQVTGGGITLASGARLAAPCIVIAAGAGAAALLPELPIFPRKGHLAITDRYPGRLGHQIVSMSYGQTEGQTEAQTGGHSAALAVAANVQPRPSGQWLVGSCRQDGQHDSAVDPAVMGAVLRCAITLLPELARMRIIRTWTGMRPATPDGRPLIGAHPGRPGIWVAGGHEGLGTTTAFASARLLADQIIGRVSTLDAAPYAPSRFAALHEVSHA